MEIIGHDEKPLRIFLICGIMSHGSYIFEIGSQFSKFSLIHLCLFFAPFVYLGCLLPLDDLTSIASTLSSLLPHVYLYTAQHTNNINPKKMEPPPMVRV